MNGTWYGIETDTLEDAGGYQLTYYYTIGNAIFADQQTWTLSQSVQITINKPTELIIFADDLIDQPYKLFSNSPPYFSVDQGRVELA